MDRITNQVLVGLANRMAVVMGCNITLERGSKYNGIAWKFVSNGGSRLEIVGMTSRELFDNTHAFLKGWYAHGDKMEADARK